MIKMFGALDLYFICSVISYQLISASGQVVYDNAYTTPTTTSTTAFTTPFTTPKFTTPRFTTPKFTTPKATAKKPCACQKLKVSGPEKYQAASMGFYTLQECNYNDKPVYKHDDRALFLYYSTSDYWGVSLAPDQGDVFLRVADKAESPANLTSAWEAIEGLNNATATYKTEPTVKVRCACNGTSCPRLTMKSTSDRAKLSGEFVSTGELLNGRPSYTNVDDGLHLYLKDTGSCVYWAVGPTLDGDEAIMVVNDAALNPEEISAKWNIHLKSDSEEEWSRQYQVTWTCLQ